MKKKGSTWTVVGWILGIFLVVIILAMYFGRDALFTKMRDEAFKLGFGTLPEERAPEFLGEGVEATIPGKIKIFYERLVSIIENNPSGDRCLIEVSETQDTEDFRIALSTNRVGIEKTDRGGFTSTGIFETFGDFNPCYVIGEGAANFYKCFIENDQESCPKKLFRSQTPVHLIKDRYSKFLFKVDGRLCPIKLYGGGCNTPRNNGDDGIPDGCKKRIEEKINKCS